MNTAIHWFRRDLRVHDNTALNRAVAQAETVWPVFIFEDAIRTGPDVGAARLQYLLDALRDLKQSLQERGYPLIVRFGKSEVEIPKLARELSAEAVFCNKRYEPYAQARDDRVFNALNALGIGFETFKDAVIWEEREILTRADEPYTVFTPYAKAWLTRKAPVAGAVLKKRAAFSLRVDTAEIPPDVESWGLENTAHGEDAGETKALQRAKEFFAGSILRYGVERDFPAVDGTSRFSAHLRAGTLSIRMLVAAVLREKDRAASAEQKEGCETFLNELIWREFYLQILHNFPHVMRGNFRPEYDALQWWGEEEHFTAWQAGQTGFPIVDAAMRCLNTTGWMHNRLRMVTAMFLTKDLLIHWQRGERFFMKRLVDGDLAANNGGWQWSAGTGTDAAPYFRIFNPVAQSEKFDRHGDFIRRWVPELAEVDGVRIHDPWARGAQPKGYPRPIVNHADQRRKALEMYEAVKSRRKPVSA